MELETERLVLKKLSESDFENVYKLQSNPDVVRYIGTGKPRQKDQVRQLFDLMLKHQIKHGFTLSPVYEKESAQLIGFAGLIHLALDDSNPDIEVGYWLLPKFWGKGYATEITTACVQWGFKHLSVESLVAITHPDHIRSQRVLDKVGFQFVKKSIYRDQDVLRFEILPHKSTL